MWGASLDALALKGALKIWNHSLSGEEAADSLDVPDMAGASHTSVLYLRVFCFRGSAPRAH